MGGLIEGVDRTVAMAIAIVRWVCIVFAAGIFGVVIYAVLARYALTHVGFRVPSWTEEVPRYLLIWISFLAGAVGIALREHVGFELVFDALPARLRRVVAAFLALLIIGFGWIVFRYGIVFVQDFGSDLMETIPHTNYWYYTAMPVSGALMVLCGLKLLLDALRGGTAGAIGTSVD
jgi:TRAP-type C4-dicarboxylate transport system permease small subunit